MLYFQYAVSKIFAKINFAVPTLKTIFAPLTWRAANTKKKKKKNTFMRPTTSKSVIDTTIWGFSEFSENTISTLLKIHENSNINHINVASILAHESPDKKKLGSPYKQFR